MKEPMARGARIITDRWLHLGPGRSILIVTSRDHLWEAELLQYEDCSLGAQADIMETGEERAWFDHNPEAFKGYDVVSEPADTFWSLLGQYNGR